MVHNYVSEDSLRSVAYTLIAVTSAFFIGRAGLRIWYRVFNLAEDSCLVIAYVFFLAMTASYLETAAEIYNESHDESADVPWSRSKSILVRKIFFANNLLFWCCLWAVKFALLSIFRRAPLSKQQSLSWWFLMTACGLTLVGAVVSNFTSCNSWHGFWTIGGCSAARDERSQQASLYYSLAVDVLTNLLLVMFGIRLALTRQLVLAHQVAIISISALGLLCITSAFLRAIEDPHADAPHLPSTSWFALWSIVEAAVTMIVGCCPGLYNTIPKPSAAQNASRAATRKSGLFESRGYRKQTTNDSNLPMKEILEPSRGAHTRILSTSGSVVGYSDFQGRTTPTEHGISKTKHVPIQLPSSSGHFRTATGGLSLSDDFWKEADPNSTPGLRLSNDPLTPTTSKTNLRPRKEILAPVINSPVVSKRNSKASLKYTPIQIPGTVGHKKDRDGSLSGAFWGEMEDGEREHLEERAKEIRIQFRETKRLRMSEDGT